MIIARHIEIGKVIVVLLAFLSNFGSVSAGYVANEMAFIPWGARQGELNIQLPYTEDQNATPQDTTDDAIFPGAGPTQAFIDRAENIYVSSYRLGYFKGFRTNGQEFLDYSSGTNMLEGILDGRAIDYFIVDSLSHIYFDLFPPLRYIAVGDTAGNLIDKLTPFNPDSGETIIGLFDNSEDVITVYSSESGYFTYFNSMFAVGGSMGWLFTDGHYYSARMNDSLNLMLKRYTNPDPDGIAEFREIEYAQLTESAQYADLLGVSDNMFLYVYIIDESGMNTRTNIYDSEFNFHAEIIFPPRGNRYLTYLTPFVSREGIVYEFRCLDDGLHVIRWSEK